MKSFCLVAPFPYDDTCCNCNDEIVSIHHCLYKGRTSLGDFQHVLKMLVEHIKYAMCKSPTKEQGCNKGNGTRYLRVTIDFISC